MVFRVYIVALASLAVGQDAWAAAQDHLPVGETAPNFTLKSINADVTHGDTFVSVDSYLGPTAKDPKKAVVINFFATYCEPCKRAMPMLSTLHEAYKDRGLVVMTVAIDKEPEKVELARTIMAQSTAKYALLSDHFNIVTHRYALAQLPTTYLVDREGKIALANIGYSEQNSRRLVDEVRRLIGIPASEAMPEMVTAFLTNHPTAGHVETIAVPGVDPLFDLGEPSPRPPPAVATSVAPTDKPPTPAAAPAPAVKAAAAAAGKTSSAAKTVVIKSKVKASKGSAKKKTVKKKGRGK